MRGMRRVSGRKDRLRCTDQKSRSIGMERTGMIHERKQKQTKEARTTAVSPPSTPVFMGRTLSYPK